MSLQKKISTPLSDVVTVCLETDLPLRIYLCTSSCARYSLAHAVNGFNRKAGAALWALNSIWENPRIHICMDDTVRCCKCVSLQYIIYIMRRGVHCARWCNSTIRSWRIAAPVVKNQDVDIAIREFWTLKYWKIWVLTRLHTVHRYKHPILFFFGIRFPFHPIWPTNKSERKETPKSQWETQSTRSGTRTRISKIRKTEKRYLTFENRYNIWK